MDKALENTIAVRTTPDGPKITGEANFTGGYPVVSRDGTEDGVFGRWNWNGRKLSAYVDRLGMFPLYYGELPDGVVISTGIEGVLRAGVNPELDLLSTQTLFGLGFQVGCYTHFRHVKRFPIGGELTWEAGRLSVTSRLPTITPNPLSREQALDGYLDLFSAAVRKRIVENAPIRMPLSGGRDSRHILLELAHLGALPKACYTSSFLTMREDVEVATALCQKLNIPHKESTLPSDLLALEREKNERINYEALEHSWTWALAQNMAAPDSISYDGLGGGVLSAGHFHDGKNIKLYREGRYEELAEVLAPAPVLRVAAPGYEASREEVYQRIGQELKAYRDTNNPLMFFFLYNRSRRAVSVTLSHLFGRTLKAVHAPYLDRDLFDFLAGLPPEIFADKRFHTEAISRKFPEFDSIPYAEKTEPPKALHRSYLRHGLRLVNDMERIPLDRRSLMLRCAKAVLRGWYLKEFPGVFYRAVLLDQIGKLANGGLRPHEHTPRPKAAA